jgi:GDPmannose 4,6-dehydratase
MKKKAVITGITGQDGSYLSEFLLGKEYEVHGFVRRTTAMTSDKVHYHFTDLTNSEQLNRLIAEIQPDELYNLAAQSHVLTSFENPELTGNITGLGTLRLLEAIRRGSPKTKFYQASSSEMYGSSKPRQGINTPFNPLSPYAAAKLYSHNIVKIYRSSYNTFAVSGILFNHESERRGVNFVTRKITRAIAAIHAGKQQKLQLGNLTAIRDWGYAPEYVEAMWVMLQQSKPDDYVVGTGEGHTIREFLDEAFSRAGLDPDKYVEITTTEMRPTDVPELIAESKYPPGWVPKTKFKGLVNIMVDSDLREMMKLG